MQKTAKIVLGILIIIAIGLWTYKYIIIDKPLKYEFVSLTFGDIEKNQLISGTLVPSREIEIKPQISGILREIYVEVGDTVDIGDQIALIEIIANPKNLESAHENLRIKKINFENEKVRHERSSKLFSKDVISKADFESSLQSFLLRQEEYKSAKEQYYIAKKGYSQNQSVSNIIKSTATGTVLEIPLKEGASITERNNFNQGSTIAVIADLESLLFEGKVNEKDVTSLKENMVISITITALDNLKVFGELKSISPKGNLVNGIMNFDLIAEVNIPEESKNLIRSGYTAIANIQLDKRQNVLLVNENDLIFDKDSIFVEVLSGSNTVIKKNIKLGISDGIKAEIISGIDSIVKIRKQK